jgi:signal recognition particle subunit SRP54
MFGFLGERLKRVFEGVARRKNLTEETVSGALKDVERALLESDVAFEAATRFIDDVRKACVGQKIFQNVEPGQQVVKIVHDQMVEVLGGTTPDDLCHQKPLRIVVVGLHGSGKTTSSVKLARWLKTKGYRPGLVACDVYRPAAAEQLATLAQREDIPCHMSPDKNVLSIVRNAGLLEKERNVDATIYDTAGRLQIDETMMAEIWKIVEMVRPQETLLVVDSALGQQSVAIAREFQRSLALTGIVLTKLDGDAKGGAAFSMKYATGLSIKFVGTGEKSSDFERFIPERMVGRILGMGDIVSFVEKAEADVGRENVDRMTQRLMAQDFNLEDFREQISQVKKLGSVSTISRFLPIPLSHTSVEKEKNMVHFEALIASMTPFERRNPHLLGTHRRLRISRGAGLPISALNKLLKTFQMAKKTVQKLKKGNSDPLKQFAQRLGDPSLLRRS